MGDESKHTSASNQPKTYDMLLESLKALDDRKGVTIPAVKSFILEHYPTVDPGRLRPRLKSAITKGFEKGTIKRTKNSELGASLTGRFRFDKSSLKTTKPKPAKREKSVEKASKKKVARSPKAVKSPKAKKVKTSKSSLEEKTAKSTKSSKSPKRKSPKSKSPKPKSPKTKSPKPKSSKTKSSKESQPKLKPKPAKEKTKSPKKKDAKASTKKTVKKSPAAKKA